MPARDRLACLRHVRDLLIGLTDWTQAADSPQAYAGAGPIPWPEAP